MRRGQGKGSLKIREEASCKSLDCSMVAELISSNERVQSSAMRPFINEQLEHRDNDKTLSILAWTMHSFCTVRWHKWTINGP